MTPRSPHGTARSRPSGSMQMGLSPSETGPRQLDVRDCSQDIAVKYSEHVRQLLRYLLTASLSKTSVFQVNFPTGVSIFHNGLNPLKLNFSTKISQEELTHSPLSITSAFNHSFNLTFLVPFALLSLKTTVLGNTSLL